MLIAPPFKIPWYVLCLWHSATHCYIYIGAWNPRSFAHHIEFSHGFSTRQAFSQTHPISATQHRQKGLCLLWWLGTSYQRLPQARDHQTEDHLGHEGSQTRGSPPVVSTTTSWMLGESKKKVSTFKFDLIKMGFFIFFSKGYWAYIFWEVLLWHQHYFILTYDIYLMILLSCRFFWKTTFCLTF